ncbi:hypothetical protein DPEC_G00185640 [Dallia pectoralis]|uniref:Uncharacterized protein n=1 Tax=Dallia pectoralis TaxID=75939 RepID=A0ACC2GBN3_DALPE|nr:hypothetical protein DPEC_G00185640 [Dallia pectoralis]
MPETHLPRRNVRLASCTAGRSHPTGGDHPLLPGIGSRRSAPFALAHPRANIASPPASARLKRRPVMRSDRGPGVTRRPGESVRGEEIEERRRGRRRGSGRATVVQIAHRCVKLKRSATGAVIKRMRCRRMESHKRMPAWFTLP